MYCQLKSRKILLLNCLFQSHNHFEIAVEGCTEHSHISAVLFTRCYNEFIDIKSAMQSWNLLVFFVDFKPSSPIAMPAGVVLLSSRLSAHWKCMSSILAMEQKSQCGCGNLHCIFHFHISKQPKDYVCLKFVVVVCYYVLVFCCYIDDLF